MNALLAQKILQSIILPNKNALLAKDPWFSRPKKENVWKLAVEKGTITILIKKNVCAQKLSPMKTFNKNVFHVLFPDIGIKKIKIVNIAPKDQFIVSQRRNAPNAQLINQLLLDLSV